ncbi:uncharacterized protein [Dysidea avara]|uniref:uncharacterized protein isoform X2 n=1 Tax=Dysidea avara TaxID=196820 RepID=UPI003317D436
MYHLQLTRIFMIDYNVHCVSSTSSTFQVIPHGCLNVTENIEFKQHPVPQEISEQIDKQNDELQNCFYNFVLTYLQPYSW